MLNKILPQHLLCLLLIIGILLIAGLARAEQSNTKIALKIKDAWLDKLENRNPIWIEVENIQSWARQPGNEISKLVLCIGGSQFNFPPMLGHDDWLGFQTDSSIEFKRMWKTCTAGSGDKSGQGVGLSLLYDKTLVDGFVVKPIVHNNSVLTTFVATILATMFLFFLLAYYTDIIREPGIVPSDKSYRKRYSLARTQMACWFFVVIFSYLFIWYLTRNLDILTSSVLALIGISSGTALGSAIIDSRKRADDEAPTPSKNFIYDVLSDDKGVSFHRFQIFAWTIVLAVIFVKTVWDGLSMPDFDSTLLALIGISGGTYIGFKLPDHQG